MYKIYVDNSLIHNEKFEKLIVDRPELELELNQVGSLKFEIYPNHPFYNSFAGIDSLTIFKKMKSIVRVYRDNELIFRGRILENEDGFYKEKQVTCEGELAFFLDSQLRPYSFTGTPAEILKYYIDIHNEQMVNNPEKQFVLGEVTITDGEVNNENREVRKSESIVSVWEEISKLLESLGGYLIIDDDEEGNRRINWLHEDDFSLGTQTVDFGKNLLNIKTNIKGDEIVTALIPVGGKAETASTDDEVETVDETTDETTEETLEERLTIESLEDGVVMETEDDKIIKQGDYIYSERGVAEYGWIFSSYTWDDILEDQNHLLEVAIEHLNKTKAAVKSIEINVLDLCKLTKVDSFKLGTKIKAYSPVHDLKGEIFPITKLNLDLTDPASNTLVLTKTERTFTETSISISRAQVDAINIAERIEKVENNSNGLEAEIINVSQQLSSKIDQSSEEIYTKVSEEFFTKEEGDNLIQSVSTEFAQTNESFEMRFNQFNTDIENLTKDTNLQFQQINKYIRFIDGKIVLGEEGNELTLNITNDRISFLQDNIEVAYFSNKEFKVVKGEFINQLTLGNFAFIPEEDGGLVFKKIK